MGSRKSYDPSYHQEKMERLVSKGMKEKDKKKIGFSYDFISRVQNMCLENLKGLTWRRRK